jgi:hypothetical protein
MIIDIFILVVLGSHYLLKSVHVGVEEVCWEAGMRSHMGASGATLLAAIDTSTRAACCGWRIPVGRRGSLCTLLIILPSPRTSRRRSFTGKQHVARSLAGSRQYP